MSHVIFKKWLCPMSLFLHVNFEIVRCRMSHLKSSHRHVSVISLTFSHMPKYLMSHFTFKKYRFTQQSKKKSCMSYYPRFISDVPVHLL